MSTFRANLKIFFQPLAAPRVMLFFPAILFKLISSALSTAAYALHSGSLTVAGMVFWVVWMSTLFLIALPQTDRLLAGLARWLKPLSITLLVVLVVVGVLEYAAAAATSTGISLPNVVGHRTSELLTAQNINLTYNDATALCHQAIDNLFEGKNPYAEANIVTANLRFNIDADPWLKTTPIRVGRFADDFPYPGDEELKSVWYEAALSPEIVPPEFETKLNYPAGSFLLAAPFVWLGIEDLRWVYLLAIIAGLAFAVVKSPVNMRLWLVGAALASLEIWQSIASGETGTLIFPFLLGAWLLWRKKLWLSAVCMGVAIATKQIAWFFMLFYLILIARTLGWKKASVVILISGGVFLAFNAVFILQDPGLWLSSVLAPMIDKFFPMGVGPVGLVVSGYIQTQSSLVFSLVEITALTLALTWYWRNCLRYPHTGIILAVVPLFFAWRSSWWYFFYFDIILLAIIIIGDYSKKVQIEPAPKSAS
ncbi:MAG: DUF2029 domain-containing protein [Dehalococcoidia bacterium]|nr:MAG: DUF2029 domain-containing protein [Dehalococcoidia bacterium]